MIKKKGELARESQPLKEKESTLGLGQLSDVRNINISSTESPEKSDSLHPRDRDTMESRKAISPEDIKFGVLMSGRALTEEQEARLSQLLDNKNLRAFIAKKGMDAFANVPPERKALMETIRAAHKAQKVGSGDSE